MFGIAVTTRELGFWTLIYCLCVSSVAYQSQMSLPCFLTVFSSLCHALSDMGHPFLGHCVQQLQVSLNLGGKYSKDVSQAGFYATRKIISNRREIKGTRVVEKDKSVILFH